MESIPPYVIIVVLIVGVVLLLRFVSNIIKCAVVIVAVVFLVFVFQMRDAQAEDKYVFITAAHIPEEVFKGCKRVYVDESRDTAIYVNENYVFTYPDIDVEVKFNDVTGTVCEYKDGVGFYIEVPSGTQLYAGLSGTIVYDSDGQELGFISAMKGKQHVLCVSTR